MGFVLQTQRRAIEALAPFAKSPWPEEIFVRCDATFRVGQENWNTPLVFRGISEGFGTCSDLHGVDIAVFAYGFWEGKDRQIQAAKLDWPRLSRCKYAVLLWPSGVQVAEVIENLTGGLKRVDPVKVNPDSPMLTVELLEFFSFKPESFSSLRGEDHFTNVYLTRTGLISSHVPI